MESSAEAGSASSGLSGGLTTPRIVFLVVAAAAPMAAMVGTVPLAFAIGDGAGTPAVFVFAGLTLLCFSVGYAAMSRRVVNTGAFYTYIASAGRGQLLDPYRIEVAGGQRPAVAARDPGGRRRRLRLMAPRQPP